jgi:hypothetical protein
LYFLKGKGYSSGQSTFSVTTNATQPRCFGDKATILVVANNVRPQYKFDLYVQRTGTLVNTSGLLTASNQFTFVKRIAREI